jgi:hypothetical protein
VSTLARTHAAQARGYLRTAVLPPRGRVIGAVHADRQLSTAAKSYGDVADGRGRAAYWWRGEGEMTNKDALTAAKRTRFQRSVAGRLATTAGDSRQRRGHVDGTRERWSHARSCARWMRRAMAEGDYEHVQVPDSAAGRRRGRGSRASPSCPWPSAEDSSSGPRYTCPVAAHENR